jgi:hypothetical protein
MCDPRRFWYNRRMHRNNAQVRPVSLVWWLVAAFAAELGLAIIALGIDGPGETGTRLALVITARFSFLLFWLAYTGSALCALFGPALLPLKRRTREFGLAFAAAQLVHLGLVAWLCHLGAVPSAATFVLFGIAVFWLYLIALLSAGGPQRMLNPSARRLIFFVGLNYIAYAFAVDFFDSPLRGGAKHVLFYLPFAARSVAGPGLRLAAFLLRIRPKPGRIGLSGTP